MKEFNIGDKVRVRKDLSGFALSNIRNTFSRRIVTISQKEIKIIADGRSFITYKIKEDNLQLNWVAEMFEEIKETDNIDKVINNNNSKSNEKNIKIMILNNEGTVAYIKDSKKGVLIGRSSWNKKDKYDEKIGILIATARALKFDEETVQDFIKAIFKEEDKKENIKKEEIKKEPKLSLVSSDGTECDFEFREEFNKLVQDMSEQILNKLNSSNIPANTPEENNIKVKIIEPKNNRGGIPRIILKDASLKNSSPKSECNCTCKTKNKESNKKEQENQTKANNSSSSKEELSNLLDKEIDKLLFLLSTLNSDKNGFNFWNLF